jgi:hypothetical protein
VIATYVCRILVENAFKTLARSTRERKQRKAVI